MKRCLICQRKLVWENGAHTRCCQILFGIPKMPEVAVSRHELDDLGIRMIRNRVSLTGVQEKLHLGLDTTGSSNRLTPDGASGHFILKPPVDDFSFLSENEALTLNLAGAHGLPVVPHGLIPLASGDLSYITRRIDRTADGRKIPMEDFCQLACLMTENKYEGSLEQAGDLILKYCTHRERDALRFFELNGFCFLTGNNDMHLKNFSLIMDRGQVILSPAYDLLNSRLITTGEDDPDETALTLDSKRSRIDRDDFIRFGRTMGLDDRPMENVLKHLASGEDKVIKLIETSFLPAPLQDDYIHIYRERKIRLAG